MKRYVEALFRSWRLALVPLIACIVVGVVMARQAPGTFLTVATLDVPSAAASALDGYNSYNSPAGNEATYLTELLGSPTFNRSVLANSAATTYVAWMTRKTGGINTQSIMLSDLAKNISLTPHTRLLTVSYKGADKNTWVGAQAGASITQAFIQTVLARQLALGKQVSLQTVQSISNQLKAARAGRDRAYGQLLTFMKANGYNTQDLATAADSITDPKFDSLYQTYLSEKQNTADVEQQFVKAQLNQQAHIDTAGSTTSALTELDGPASITTSSKTKQLLNMALYLLPGLVLALGIVVGTARLDRTVRYADEIPTMLGLPALTVVPYGRRPIGSVRNPQVGSSSVAFLPEPRHST